MLLCLVFPSHSGLEVFLDGKWQDIDVPAPDTAVMLFGWCTQIRSNGRIPALLHRVKDAPPADTTGALNIPRRVSAVLFCAPKRSDTPLEPVVQEGEERVYISGVLAGQLRGKMARKWRQREGTISAEDRILEEKEILFTKMVTQDDVVQNTVAV